MPESPNTFAEFKSSKQNKKLQLYVKLSGRANSTSNIIANSVAPTSYK